MPAFADRLLAWFDQHGRKNLPWQHPREPYRVWLSEIMLQQTQVATVIPYFERFLARFPDVRTLAAASLDDVVQLWAGLGYYARARNLHKAAQAVVAQHGGEFPTELEAMVALPGIGRSTAGAILSQAHGQRHAILDGNVRRVLARHAAIAGWPGAPAVQTQLWTIAQSLLPATRLADYTQAIMDLGAQVCTARKPACGRCPVSADCRALALERVGDFPAAKPRRERPQRRAWLLLIQNEHGEHLLERRPPAGIWGALWCPPMLDHAQDWREALRERYGMDAEEVSTLPSVHHGFTHFDLELLPLQLRASTLPAIADDGERRWIRIARSAGNPGLPAPVRKLFDALYSAPLLPLDFPQCPEPSTA